MTINLICIHCAATPPTMDIGAEEIDRWHKEKGWSRIGYSEVIRRNGAVEPGREEGATLAHARGHNRNAIAICLVGGVDANGEADANFTDAQIEMLKSRVDHYSAKYPGARICGHRELDPGKACPSFDVQHWRATGEVRA